MCDSFRIEMLDALENDLSEGQLKLVEAELLKLLQNYEVTRKTTELAIIEDIPEAVKIYIASRKVEGAADKTLVLYTMRLRQFFRTVRKPLPLLTPNDLRLYLFTYQQEHNISNRTLDAIRTVLSSFFKWAACEQYLPYDITAQIKPIKYRVREREALTNLELEQLRAACKTARERAIIDVLYSTGCRVSELINIKLTDIGPDGKTVELFGKGSKYRTAFFNDRAQISIKNYMSVRKGNSPYLFVGVRAPYKPIHKNQVEAIVSRLGKEAGIQRPVFPHLIRHSTATIALDRGMDIVDVQKVLGHENIATTMIYAKRSMNAARAAHTRYIV